MRFFSTSTRLTTHSSRPSNPAQTLLTGAILCLSALALSGCVASASPIPPPVVKTISPEKKVTVLADPTAAGLAVEASKTLFAKSSTVVIASTADPLAQKTATAIAVRWGVPLLLVAETPVAPTGDGPAGDAPDPSLNAALQRELSRLGVREVATVDMLNAGDTLRSAGVTVSGSKEAGSKEAGVTVVDAKTTTHRRITVAPRPGVAVVVTADPRAAAATATARAAGASLHALPIGVTDLQASATAITFLHSSQTSHTVLIGADFSSLRNPDWSVAAARTGYQLAGGGQRLFPAHRFVALYGAPGVPGLGVAGEQDAAATIARAQAVAATYAPLSTVPVMPMLELIATVAAADAGADGNYSNELPIEALEPLVDAATKAGLYVVLDLQPGRSTFLEQAKRYLPLLQKHGVGLALDPEWRLGPNQLPLQQIGSVDASEINSVSEWLAGVVSDGALAPKMLVLHQFTTRMITDRASIDTSHQQLELVLHVDGQGAQPDKQATWRALHTDAPAALWWGWKNFYDEDRPMLTPEQTLSEVEPQPQLITYQ